MKAHQLISSLFIAVLALAPLKAQKIGIFYDHSIPQFEFAASDISAALESMEYETEHLPISELSAKYRSQKIVITRKSGASALKLLKKEGGRIEGIEELNEQGYALRSSQGKQKSYWAIGGDIAGAMYGGLQLAEYIAFGELSALEDEEQEPHILKRGIKFNITLDQRVPTFSSRGDQEKSNVKDMWDMEFWIAYLDDLARYRYNTLSYWTKHPFTTMIKLEDYPDVEVHDVIDGYGNFVKKMSIDDKIKFWP